MKIQLAHKFEDIVSVENLLEAWKEFIVGKKSKKDVQEFSMRLMENILELIENFLHKELKLELHSDKVSIETFSSGVDFLGMVNFSDYRILRTKTKRRMFKKLYLKHKLFQEGLIFKESFSQSAQSCKGMLKHCMGYAMVGEIEKIENEYS